MKRSWVRIIRNILDAVSYSSVFNELKYMQSYMAPYAVANVGCFALDLAIVFLLTHVFFLHHSVTIPLSFLTTSVVLFLLSRYWVFRKTQTDFLPSLGVFTLVTFVKLAVAYVLIVGMITLLGFETTFARLLSGIIEAILAFLLDYLKTFAMQKLHD